MALFDALAMPSLLDRLDSISNSLKRLADAADRACPPIDEAAQERRRNRSPSTIIRYGKEDTGWAKEQFRELIGQEGLAPEQESAALAEVMGRWTSQNDEHGED